MEEPVHLHSDSKHCSLHRSLLCAVSRSHLEPFPLCTDPCDRFNWPGERFVISFFLSPQAGTGKLLPKPSQALFEDGPEPRVDFTFLKGCKMLF